MPESKTKIKETKMKVFYNPEMEDLPFPEPLSYKLLVEVPQGLEDINETEGIKLAGIEEGAMNLSLHDSDDLPEGAINKYLLDNAVTELKLAAEAVTEAKIAVAAVTEAKIAADAITTDKILNAAIVASKIHTDYKILEILSSLPSPGTAGRLVYLTTDGKIYRDNGSAWKQVILPSEVTSHLGGEGVGTIGTTKIDNLAITTPKLAANSVSTEKLVAGSVTADIIAASAVIAEKISSYAITAIKIAASAVTAEKIQAGAVTTDKIQAYAVTSSKVTTGQLITLSAQIASAIINNAHISSLSADKITTGTLTAILVQTAGSGRRVVMETSGGYYANFIAYDTGGTMAGRMYGDSGNCMLVGWLDITANCGAFRPVSSGSATLGTSSYYWGTAYLGSVYSYSLYPRSSLSYNLGSSSYYWMEAYCANLRLHSSYGRIYYGGDLVFDFYSAEVRTSKDFVDANQASHNVGSAGLFFNEINAKYFTDRGCLGVFDEGVEMPDGRKVSDIEALKLIQKHPTLETGYGVPRLDYATMPKAVFKPAPIAEKDVYDDKEKDKLLYKKGEKMGEDGAELTALTSIMIGAMKDLDQRVKSLEKK